MVGTLEDSIKELINKVDAMRPNGSRFANLVNEGEPNEDMGKGMKTKGVAMDEPAKIWFKKKSGVSKDYE